MDFSPYGALSQMFIIDAIGKYIDYTNSYTEEDIANDRGIIDAQTWVNTGKDIDGYMKSFYAHDGSYPNKRVKHNIGLIKDIMKNRGNDFFNRLYILEAINRQSKGVAEATDEQIQAFEDKGNTMVNMWGWRNTARNIQERIKEYNESKKEDGGYVGIDNSYESGDKGKYRYVLYDILDDGERVPLLDFYSDKENLHSDMAQSPVSVRESQEIVRDDNFFQVDKNITRSYFEDEPYYLKKGGKAKSDPQIVRYYFEDEPYEYSLGGSMKGGGLLYGYEKGLWFDHILEGADATEENAYDHARGIDWQDIETTEDEPAYMQYVDTVNGVGIYHNYGTDSYHFKDEVEQDDEYEGGGKVKAQCTHCGKKGTYKGEKYDLDDMACKVCKKENTLRAYEGGGEVYAIVTEYDGRNDWEEVLYKDYNKELVEENYKRIKKENPNFYLALLEINSKGEVSDVLGIREGFSDKPSPFINTYADGGRVKVDYLSHIPDRDKEEINFSENYDNLDEAIIQAKRKVNQKDEWGDTIKSFYIHSEEGEELYDYFYGNEKYYAKGGMMTLAFQKEVREYFYENLEVIKNRDDFAIRDVKSKKVFVRGTKAKVQRNLEDRGFSKKEAESIVKNAKTENLKKKKLSKKTKDFFSPMKVDADEIATTLTNMKYGNDWWDGENYKNEDVEAFYVNIQDYANGNWDNPYIEEDVREQVDGMKDGIAPDDIFAKGGMTERTSNQQSSQYTRNREPFNGSNLSGKIMPNKAYVVLSYGYYPLYVYKYHKWYENKEKYSVSTSKQLGQSRPTGSTIKKTTKQLEKLAGL